MIKNRKIFTISIFTLIYAVFSGCKSQFNKDVMYGTVGSKLEKIAPGKVTQLNALEGDSTIELSWVNPTDSDLYGVKLSVTSKDISAFIPNPVTLTNEEIDSVPETYTFHNLTNKKSYTITLQTFDKNLNYSSGESLVASPNDNSEVEKINSASAIAGDGFVILNWENKKFSGFSGVSISYSTYNPETSETGVVSTINLPKDLSTGSVPQTYTFYNLINDTTYRFEISQYGDKINPDGRPNMSGSLSCNATPAKDKNIMQISSFQTEENYDSSALVTWVNPTDENFYGIQITAEPAEGNLSTPVYFLKKTDTEIPTSFLVTGVLNNKKYNIIIKTLDRSLNLAESGASTGIKPAPTSNNQDIQNFRALPGNGYVNLYWKEPADTSLLNVDKAYELTISPSVVNLPGIINYSLDEVKDSEDPSLCHKTISGCVNGQTYTFTIRTVDVSNNKSPGISAQTTPDSGSSGILDSEDLVTYKKTYRTYDFGYCKSSTTKVFTFTSTTDMDLSKTELKSVMGKGKYKFEYAKNITDGSVGKTTVKQADEFEIAISYTPSAYDKTSTTASWDEADVFVGGETSNRIRLIGSNFPQPKSLSTTENQLRIWLRADMITSNDLSDNGKVKTMPDYSGNGFNASSTDPKYDKAPAFNLTDSDFNNLPVVDFANGSSATGQAIQQSQLIATGTPGNPIITGEHGSTAFVVYMLGNTAAQYISEQTVISANYGTSWPVLKNSYRYYNEEKGWFVTNDYKYGLSVRGSGMTGTWRFACISNETENNPYNRMLITGAHTSATGVSNKDNIGAMVLSSSLVYNRDLSSTRKPSSIAGYDYDYPSNVRMYVNGEERLLAYIESQSSTYTESYLKNRNPAYPFLETNKFVTVGQYGLPWGDGKGHKYGTLSTVLEGDTVDKEEQKTKFANPRSSTAGNYQRWLAKTSTAAGRPFDRAMTYSSPHDVGAAGSSTLGDASDTKQSDFFENWLPTDLWRNGTINTLTLGADFNNAYYAYSRIAEVFIFEGHLSDEEIEEMNNYIKYRYNISDISTNVADYRTN